MKCARTSTSLLQNCLKSIWIHLEIFVRYLLASQTYFRTWKDSPPYILKSSSFHEYENLSINRVFATNRRKHCISFTIYFATLMSKFELWPFLSFRFYISSAFEYWFFTKLDNPTQEKGKSFLHLMSWDMLRKFLISWSCFRVIIKKLWTYKIPNQWILDICIRSDFR